ncbi:MAG: hypothetical protein AAAC50_02175 [Rhizobium altiplani]|uniref:hypothetical protein n=1 Tax=Rhizobium altiplani TaxID=1864509 RepID=UPI0030F1E8EC
MKVPPDRSRYGTVEWLVNAYLKHSSFTERVVEFSRPDYRRVLDSVCDVRLAKGPVGDAMISNIAVSTAEKIYEQFGGTRIGRHPL